MKTITVMTLMLAMAASSANAAQLYRWVDDKGNVEWRDTPPPPHAKKVEQRNVGANTIETSSMPYSVQQAMKNNPVTLWTFDCGEPCTKASAHLTKRGIPHTVRYSNKEPDALKKLTGGTDVPVLVVGSQVQKGYLDTTWDSILDNAGYPKTAPPGMKAQVTAKSEAKAKGSETAAKGATEAKK